METRRTQLNEFQDEPHSRARGRQAEEEAERWLRKEGYEIVARNVTNEAGEIDVIAQDGETLCFIEVKARAGDRYGPAIEAVTAAKRARLIRAARLYLAVEEIDPPCRFDVLGMDPEEGGWSFTLIRDAFQVGG